MLTSRIINEKNIIPIKQHLSTEKKINQQIPIYGNNL